jgi:galactosyl transferase GMA12/MNN10 family
VSAVRARLRQLIERIPGARAVWHLLNRLRTPPLVRWKIDVLTETVERLDKEVAELRELLAPPDASIGLPEPVGEDRQATSAGGRRQSRVLCSIGAGPYRELLEISQVTYRGYADRHGYDLDLRTELPAPDRPASWSKVHLARNLLDEYEEVFWIDADAIFVDISEDIAGHVKPGKDLYLVEHIWEGGKRRNANFGVFLIRSTPWSRQLLDDIWNSEQYINHAWWENAALIDMLGYEIPPDLSPPRKVRTTELEERIEFLGLEWNSGIAGDSRSPNPRIRHYGGRSLPALRRGLMADLVTYRLSLRNDGQSE